MGVKIRFFEMTEAEILALSPGHAKLIERAFYYPSNKNYFYQFFNGVMKRFGTESTAIVEGVGVTLNNKVIGGIKNVINSGESLEIPMDYEYNSTKLTCYGNITCYGELNVNV